MRAYVQVFKRVGNSAIRLLLVPGIIEAFFDGGIAIAIFGMPPLFAFALGFILKAVGPALVIQCMFEVQQKRLGAQKCEPRINLAPSGHERDACCCMCIHGMSPGSARPEHKWLQTCAVLVLNTCVFQ